VCDEFLLVADGRAVPFDGDLDDYLGWLAARRGAAAGAETPGAAQKAARKEERAAVHAERQDRLARRRPLVKESGQLERKLAQWQQEKRALDAELAAGAEAERLAACARRQAEIARLIEAAEQRWLEIHAELEAIGAI
jgi:ATP-binding cassette subfamily F protein 3